LNGMGTGFVNLGSESGGSSAFRNFTQRTQWRIGEKIPVWVHKVTKGWVAKSDQPGQNGTIIRRVRGTLVQGFCLGHHRRGFGQRGDQEKGTLSPLRIPSEVPTP
jgi:hypothetical protein